MSNNPLVREVIMDSSSSRSSSPVNMPNHLNAEQIARLKKLYPYTDLDQIPKQWSSKDKANYITLSEDGLKVLYKGVGKTHKDAAAIRASNPIPLSCLLYYYEVKIVSKGRDGYMGIGLAAQGVNMQRLPGWDKQSYGYHGDDGHSFNSSGTGQPYGPTFTTGDIIGCGYNLIKNLCFYTKNGHNLGVAFVDLPQVPLFPTVGLQTPGEELEANFGIKPFCYDIEQDIFKLRNKVTTSINLFPVNHTEWQPMIHNLVQSWLIHNGYCSTAQVFSEYTQIPFVENIQNVKQRLKIQQLVLSGKIGEAIQTTNRLYPTVLQDDHNLLFALKCRQFIEFVCGNDDLPFSANGNDCNGNSEIKMDLDINSDDNEDLPSNFPNQLEDNSVHNNNDVNHTSNNIHSSNDNVDRFKMILMFGKELNSLAQKLDADSASKEINKKMLEEAWFFIAFSDPSEATKYLNHLDRETVCQRLNNAIVNLSSGTQKVAIETVIKHTKALIGLNNYCGAWIMDNV
ncbi:ran-binding protein M [Dermatophagoides pteronyssinus]|uniref:Ran-binding protein 10 n=2 Tax=Dermatophagoides pteronyssinus TaxID=6956 RepID=A0ABQ8JNV5_DERPT|nr:ran-binding protein 9-like [Dermatophagoides pteronyssinus]KAH9424187.1 Ran-binding protein 10 [Dermatophagoides pteronyssinus]